MQYGSLYCAQVGTKYPLLRDLICLVWPNCAPISAMEFSMMRWRSMALFISNEP